MAKISGENLARIKHVAEHLGPLLDKSVFVGGIVTGFLITDEGAPDVRPTIDVDVIMDIGSRIEYYKLEEELRNLGFSSSKEIICRWFIGEEIVDIMPTDETILGFSNRWYKPTVETATEIVLQEDLAIRVAAPPYFLGTKLEAFRGRGKNDYRGSHDMEDIVVLRIPRRASAA